MITKTRFFIANYVGTKHQQKPQKILGSLLHNQPNSVFGVGLAIIVMLGIYIK